VANLTTLAKVKRYLGPEAEDTISADDILTDLIASSSAWVENRIGRSLSEAAYTETRDGNGDTRMILEHYPVADSPELTLTVDGETLPKRTTVDGDGWVLTESEIGVLDLVGYLFTVGVDNVVISYTAGYATVPADIEQACIEHVALRYSDRKRIGVDSMSAGGESAQFSNVGALAYIEGVLDSYRDLSS
jgi:hypothetical protein